MKLAVIGLGAIAPYFVSAIDRDPTLTLAAVCDLDDMKLMSWRQNGVATFTDYRELLDSGLIDGVVITLPNDLHAEVACAALAKGVAVCCEKPMAVTVEEAARMVDVANRSETVLFTAFHRRYNRHLLDLAARLPADHSRIAHVVHRYQENIEEHTGGDAWYLDLARCGGGCVIDNGPNALDAVRYLLGDLRLVDATIGDVRSGNEFYAELDLRSASGVAVRVELDWALPTGEVKDIEVHLHDGTVLGADLLAGYTEFKSSLEHEYSGILTAFREAVAEGRTYRDPGPDVVALVAHAYKVARTKETRQRMVAKKDCSAAMVKLLFHTRDDRGMKLSPWGSRCVSAGEIHELVTTTDRPVREGERVDNVGFLGFAEFLQATVLERGDEVWLGGDQRLGKIIGFDECHFPNHYNVLIEVPALVTAADLDLRPGDAIHVQRGSQ
ncbi:Gfo/Idh/MocA family protein [Saccharopolyspora phatthalungensis]|uniref:Putative dehydrogenase n=1 Tax=Saccharopolyspora phatthalungensis TaxID=664693 RepID=A0A840QF63_9PSEU|nr:Gfo/Idh/MocA family oxidoreductase [Saccharopolyspora phatthalungensis]MBB5157229.1 putative dehydrogenase [Saccharopolyspora phatthalungensis]